MKKNERMHTYMKMARKKYTRLPHWKETVKNEAKIYIYKQNMYTRSPKKMGVMVILIVYLKHTIIDIKGKYHFYIKELWRKAIFLLRYSNMQATVWVDQISKQNVTIDWPKRFKSHLNQIVKCIKLRNDRILWNLCHCYWILSLESKRGINQYYSDVMPFQQRADDMHQ